MGLANRRVVSIERKSDETNAALARVEQALADIVRDIKSGSRSSSASDERGNIWTELKRELRVEGYPAEVVHEHKDEIIQYFLNLRQDSDLDGEIVLDDTELPVANNCGDKAQSPPRHLGQDLVTYSRRCLLYSTSLISSRLIPPSPTTLSILLLTIPILYYVALTMQMPFQLELATSNGTDFSSRLSQDLRSLDDSSSVPNNKYLRTPQVFVEADKVQNIELLRLICRELIWAQFMMQLLGKYTFEREFIASISYERPSELESVKRAICPALLAAEGAAFLSQANRVVNFEFTDQDRDNVSSTIYD